MDFRSPQCVIDAIKARTSHGIFGYSDADESYLQALENWTQHRYGWKIKRDWLVTTQGVITSVFAALRIFTKPGDSIIIQPPVYQFFRRGINENKRKVVDNPLILKDGRYTIDFDDFEKKISDNQVKMFILCNPHNPIGRVWTRDELERLGDICHKYQVLVVSDEIHQDFVFSGHRHVVFSSVKQEFERISIICHSPTKTFNLSGAPLANVFIADPLLRETFEEELWNGGYGKPGALELTACEAAYTGGEEWIDALLEYLEGNINFIDEFLKERLPRIKLIKPEGTYLAWLDFRSLEPQVVGFDNFITKEANLFLINGLIFGKDGEGFQRLNAACSRSVIETALVQLEKAIGKFW
jgi:cystathionine beta-lyase